MVRRRQRPVAEKVSGHRHLVSRQVDRRRAAPILAEQLRRFADDARHPGGHREAACGVRDRWSEGRLEIDRAVVAQRYHPGIEGSRHDRGKQSRSRYLIDIQRPEIADGSLRRRNTLTAHHDRFG